MDENLVEAKKPGYGWMHKIPEDPQRCVARVGENENQCSGPRGCGANVQVCKRHARGTGHPQKSIW